MSVIKQGFKFANNIGDDGLMNQLETNMKTFLDWALLKVGGFTNITVDESGPYGGDFSQLRPVDDPFYTDGQVWESFRKDWVWETGVEYTNSTGGGPYEPSGVQTLTVGGSASAATYTVNYPLGRIILDTAIAQTSEVQLTYAFRDVQVYVADHAPWWTEIQFNSHRNDDAEYTNTGSGIRSVLNHHRVQLPAVIVESVARGTSVPYEVGNKSLIRQQDVVFHVLAENRYIRNNLVDAIANLSDDTILLFDNNEIAASSAFPLNASGDLVAGAIRRYPDFVKTPNEGGYQWKKCRFENAVVSELETLQPTLYEGTVRVTTEVILGSI